MANKQNKPETSFVNSDWASIANVHRFSHQAMATTFEVIVQHEERLYARQACDAAFDELDRIEGQLSRYIENSDVARMNSLPVEQALQLCLDTCACLKISACIHAQTGGAFDVTVGFLLDCWLDKDKKPRKPSPEELQFAREHTGMDLIVLDEAACTVTLAGSPVRIDLGGVGKGYGVDRMAEMLGEWSIDRALIHGGFSSALALGAPQGTEGWPITLSHPRDRGHTLARLRLKHAAVSGSGLEKGEHIIDPRLARPVEGKIAAWSMASDAACADALSTAFMVMAPHDVTEYCARHQDVRALLILQGPDAEGSAERIVPAGAWKEGELAD